MHDLSIIVPFYNEEDNVNSVVFDLKKELIRNKIDFELVLVDNGSHDKTPSLVDSLKKKDKRIKVVHVEKNLGYGYGIILGLNVSSSKYVGYTDGDGQIRAEGVVNCYNRIRETNSDLCKGRRSRKEGTLLRKFFSYSYDFLFFLLFLRFYLDVNAKPKIFKRSYLDIFNLESKEWFIDSEIIIKAIKNELKISEVNVVVNVRKKGKSHVRYNMIFNFLKNLLLFRLKSFLGQL